MRKLFLLAALAALPFTITGCGSTCNDVCDYLFTCTVEEDLNCEFEDRDKEFGKCIDDCNDAADRLSGDERGEFDACISCVADEVGPVDECRDGDLSDAFGDCDDECEEDGYEEFVERFDYPSTISQNDLDC